jgi:hypothetical protein
MFMNPTRMGLQSAFYFLALLLAVKPTVALAYCTSPHDVCADMNWCMFTNPWPNGPDNTENMAQLQAAARSGSESGIWAWTDRCQHDVGGNYSAWQNASAGCASNPAEHWGAILGTSALKAGPGGTCPGVSASQFYCVTGGQYYQLDGLECTGPAVNGAACSCDGNPGQVYQQ